MNAHSSYAAVSEYWIQELPWRRIHNVLARHVHELSAVESIERFAAKLQSFLLAHDKDLCYAQIPIVGSCSKQRVASYRSAIRETLALDEMDIPWSNASTCVRISIASGARSYAQDGVYHRPRI